MKLLSHISLILLVAFAPNLFADEVVSGIKVSGGTSDQQRTIGKALTEISTRFPFFFQQIKSAGLKSILIAEIGRNDQLGWAGDGKGNIWIFPRAFTPVEESDIPSAVQIKMVLIHEMGHLFPDSVSERALQLTGWKRWSSSTIDECNRRYEEGGFKCGYGGRKAAFHPIETSWISEDDYMKERAAVKSAHGQEPLEIQLTYMRQRLIKYGYPSAYSITGGPVESFPEFVAHIAFDPKAINYIPEPTFKWFTENVLK